MLTDGPKVILGRTDPLAAVFRFWREKEIQPPGNEQSFLFKAGIAADLARAF